MTNDRAHLTVTRIGAVAVGVWAAVWVMALAYGYNVPESWVGSLINWPLGVPIVIFGTASVLVIVGKLFEARGHPFFKGRS
jgi:hypothetical protein